MLIAERTPRVGDRLALVKVATSEGEELERKLVDVATVVRKELPCERYMVQLEDESYAMLFICTRTKTWWIMELDESEEEEE